jgi:hypothetical protein
MRKFGVQDGGVEELARDGVRIACAREEGGHGGGGERCVDKSGAADFAGSRNVSEAKGMRGWRRTRRDQIGGHPGGPR